MSRRYKTITCLEYDATYVLSEVKSFPAENIQIAFGFRFCELSQIVSFLLTLGRVMVLWDEATYHGLQCTTKSEPELVARVSTGRFLQAQRAQEVFSSLFIGANVQTFELLELRK